MVFSAYIQEIGRCGREGTMSKATLFYNNNDVGGNVVHLQDEMREYVRLTTCRRRFLMNYFGFAVDDGRDRHYCCDNCRRSCHCNCEICLSQLLEHACNMEDSVTAHEDLRKCCLQSLTYYFSLENSVIGGPIPQARQACPVF